MFRFSEKIAYFKHCKHYIFIKREHLIKFLHHIKFLFSPLLFLCLAFVANAQDISDTPPTVQHVCIGEEVTYTVYGFVGSTIEWYIDGGHLSGEDDVVPDDTGNVTYNTFQYNKVTLTRTWNTAGTYTITVKESSADGCETSLGDVELQVHVHAVPSLSAAVTDVSCSGDTDGAINLTVSGGENSALSFSGTSQPIELDASQSISGLGAFTLEGWIQFSSDMSSGQHSLFGQNDAIEFGFNNGNLTIWTGNGGAVSYPYTSYPNDGKWHHVAAVGNGSSLKLYVDGEEVASGGPSTSNYGSSSYRMRIGAGVWNGGSTSNPFDGQMSAVRFWTVARSASEISDGMTQKMKGTETGLYASYNLAEGSGTTISGVGSNAPDITIPGALTWQTSESIFAFSWTKQGDASFSSSLEDLTNLSAGTYDVTVSSAVGCSVNGSYEVKTSPDDEDPVISNCPTGDITVGSCNNTVNWTTPTATDNCSVTLTSTHNPGDVFSVGTTNVVYTATDGAGNTATCSFNVIVDAAPTADAGSDATIGSCGSSSTTLNGSGTGNALTYSWTPTTGLDDASKADPIANPASTTTYSLTVTDTYGCTATDQMTVTVDAAPTADAGSDATIGSCGSSTTTLNGSGTGNTLSYSWTPTTGLDDASKANPIANPASTTTYTLTVTDTYGCTATDQVTVTVDAAPTADAGSDATIGSCGSSTTTLNGSGTGNTLTYSWTPTTGLDDASKANPIANPASTTTYTLTVTDTYGCTATDQVTVTVDAAPTADAGSDATIGSCGSSTITLNGSGTGNTLSYSWTPTTGLDDASKADPIANPASTTTYTLTVTDTYGCKATDQMTVTVLPAVTISLETSSIVCNGDNAQVTITAEGGTGAYTYSSDNVTYQASNVFSLPAGTHTLYVKDGNNCVAQDDITISEPSAIATNLTITTSDICFGDAGVITIEDYESDVTYTLFEGASSIAYTSSISGSDLILTIDASVLNTEKTYNITIKAERGGCTLDMDTGVSIAVEHKPVPSGISF